MSSAHGQATRRNAVRFDLLGELQMDRLQFSRQILQKELGFSTNQLEYIFAYPGKKIFEVVFSTMQLFENCLERFKVKKETSAAFREIAVTPLVERDIRTVHVMIFSEKVRNQDVWTWMARHCEVINAMEVMDIDGIKTGTRRFQVRLNRQEGVMQHIPSSIQLGAFRGTVFYSGQPKECRKCGGLDHLAAACTRSFCKNCKASDHTSAQCSTPLKCNLCSSVDHRFRDCPQAYSNRLKSSIGQIATPSSQTLRADEPEGSQTLVSDSNALPQPSGTTILRQSEELPPDEGVEAILDWSAEPPGEGIVVSNYDMTSMETTDILEPVGSPQDTGASAHVEKLPMMCHDHDKILDILIANLPASRGAANPPQPQKPRQESSGGKAGVLPPIPSSRPAPTDSQAKKRQQESPTSGESSPLPHRDASSADWSVSSPTSQPFLEPNDVAAFSSTTLIKDMTLQTDYVRVKKKKVK